jgi:hypothetical protein
MGTDFTPTTVFAQRIKDATKRGDKPMYGWIELKGVQFDSNFDQFAASVAYALRTYMTYRTDGGKTARGLVRVSGDLQLIYQQYMKAKPPNGSAVRMNALLIRRQDPDPTRRWMMNIQFDAPDILKFDDGDVIVASPEAQEKSYKALMERMVHQAALDSKSFKGDRGRRIQDMVAIADRLGYPKNWDLWYYARGSLMGYVKWESSQPNEENNPNSTRRKMTAKTGGKTPFDGDTGFPGRYSPWRIYPFRDAAKQCMGKDADSCRESVARELTRAEDEILREWSEIDKEIARVQNLPGDNPFKFTSKAADGLGPLAVAFLEHLNGLLNTPDSLYSVYRK